MKKMLNIGPLELILIMVVVLVVFGPGKMPEVARALGKAVREFRKASASVQRVWDEVARENTRQSTGSANISPASQELASSDPGGNEKRENPAAEGIEHRDASEKGRKQGEES